MSKGYGLIKGTRTRDHNNFGGYMVAYGTESPYHGVAAGPRFELSLDDVEAWIS
jgi:hypothetical protein